MPLVQSAQIHVIERIPNCPKGGKVSPSCKYSTKRIIVTQHIEKDQLGQKIKITFCYFLNGCFFSSILVQRFLKSDITFLRYGNFINEKLILRRRLLKCGNLHKVLVFGQFRGPFLHENTIFAPNLSRNLKIKYWRLQNMWNLKIDFGTIFWDILTLYPQNSKSSLLKTSTFRYLSHNYYYFIRNSTVFVNTVCNSILRILPFVDDQYQHQKCISEKILAKYLQYTFSSNAGFNKPII